MSAVNELPVIVKWPRRWFRMRSLLVALRVLGFVGPGGDGASGESGLRPRSSHWSLENLDY